MTTTFLNRFLVATLLSMFALSLFSTNIVFAQEGGLGPGGGQEGGLGPGGAEEGGLGPSQGLSLQNPLASDDIFELLSQLLDVLMVFAVPLIVFMIIYAGFLYVTARGNPGQISNAHKALTYAVVGGVLILGAWVILEVIQGTVDAFR